MGEPVMILGKPGSGKSYSLRNMDPDRALIISVDGKRMPFPTKEWRKLTKEDLSGSMYIPTETGSKAYKQIMKAGDAGVENGKNVIVIDDSQYLMANEFFNRAYEKGFDKFVEMGKQFHDLIVWAKNLPEDIIIFFLHHLELDADGSKKVKTVGKLLDNQTSLEGKFTICLLAEKDDENYLLRSSVPSESIFKVPPGMLEKEMDNDLALVDKAIREFYGIGGE